MAGVLTMLTDYRAMKQAQAAHAAGTPEGTAYLAESRRYGVAIDRIVELEAALRALCEEYRGYDLPYGSKAYARANEVLNRS